LPGGAELLAAAAGRRHPRLAGHVPDALLRNRLRRALPRRAARPGRVRGAGHDRGGQPAGDLRAAAFPAGGRGYTRADERLAERRRMPPTRVFGFAGWSGSGKTTLIEQLIPRFVLRGLKVSLIKHAHHLFDIDKPGKGSYRHREAGASEVLITSDQRWGLLHELRDEAEPSQVGRAHV